MFQVTNLTNDAKQNMGLQLPDGSIIQLSIYYITQQQGWFITNLTYGSFILNGVRICNSLNMLHQFRNQIPFGLLCTTVNSREPMLIDDFSNENSSLYVLTESEVAEVTSIISAGV